MTTKEIKQHYKTEFSSSPVKITQEEIDLLIKHECQCSYCCKEILEMWDFPNLNTEKDEIICEDCYKTKYQVTCPICEEWFDKATKPEDQILIISSQSVEEYNLSVKPGFYQVKEWPYFYGNCVTGFDGLFDNTIELIRECDINSMLYKLQPHNGKEKVSAGECCHACMEKYTGKTEIVNNYCNKRYGAKRVKLEKQVIVDGK